jgi:alpha-tubulin suppressor-like RCC1 family protein
VEDRIRGNAKLAGVAIAFLATALLPCAKAAGAVAEGWGVDRYGTIGNPTATVTASCECVPVPVAVTGLNGITQIAAGELNTLALLANGTVMAWGANFHGQLGDGTVGGTSALAKPVPGLRNVVAVAVGGEHDLALLEDGTVESWGQNFAGQLGTAREDCGLGVICEATPTPVPGLSNVVAIAAGARFSLALLADGTVMAWGEDGNGQLGDGAGLTAGCKCDEHPRAVPGLAGVMAISAGRAWAMALRGDGSVEAWGDSSGGQLGAAPSATACTCLGPAAIPGLRAVRSIDAGGDFGMASLSSGGVETWGHNLHGELGNGAATADGGCNCLPGPAPAAALRDSEAVSAGRTHGLSLLAGGAVASWGNGRLGQLGDGTTVESKPRPAGIAGVDGVSDVVAGVGDSFVLIGPRRQLQVQVVGSGSGAVGGPRVLCGGSCSVRYPEGRVEILRAQPLGGDRFAGFTGACRGLAPCAVRLDQDRTVTATFGAPRGTRITKVKLNRRRRSIALYFDAPGAITGFECALAKPRKRRRARPRVRFRLCSNPKRYRRLPPGRYSFRVRALDIVGPDPHPAVRRFRVR